MIKIEASLCPQNHKCPMVMVCPQKAISQRGFSVPKIESKKCIECGLCVKNCPEGAFYRC